MAFTHAEQMTREQWHALKKKYRTNYIGRVLTACIYSCIVFIFDYHVVFIVSLIHISLCLIWIVMVEFEIRFALIEELRYLRITIDLVGFTAMNYVTGGINTFSFLAYLILISLASFYLTRRYAIFTIVMSHAMYNLILILIYTGVIPMVNILSPRPPDPSDINAIGVIMTNAILLALSIIIHSIVHALYKNLQNERDKLHRYNVAMEREVSLARRIQEELIPSEAPSQHIYALYKPMQQVGGDFYDFLVDPTTGAIGIFLSDVSGHGVPASLITTMIKTIILQAGDRIHDPAALLHYVNDVLQNQTAGNFVTAFYCRYDPATGMLRYSSAGHPQPYLITAHSITPLQGGKNTAIAMFPNNLLSKMNKRYENYTTVIPKGAKLLLYTDGLTEARPLEGGDLFFEYHGLIKALSDFHQLPCREFIHALHRRLVDFREADSFDDDICLICIDNP